MANWLNLIGQVVETYATQQVYSESGPGRYYSPLYRNVTNPFCSCTEVSNSTSSNSEDSAGSDDGNNSEDSAGSTDSSNSANSGSSTDSSSNGTASGDDNSGACSEENDDTNGEDTKSAEDDNKENLKKSIERIDNEISYMKKQFSIFNEKMEELRRNLENIE